MGQQSWKGGYIYILKVHFKYDFETAAAFYIYIFLISLTINC